MLHGRAAERPAGYPSAAVVLQQPRQPDRSEEPQLQPVDGWDLTAETVDALSELDEGSRVRRESLQPAMG